MSGNRDPRLVLAAYGLCGEAVERAEPLAGAGGWSGSRLWRVTSNRRQVFCLRRWPPEHPNAARLSFIHAVLGHVAAKLPIVATPLKTSAGATFVEQAGYLWELTAWMPGQADYGERPNRQRLSAAMHVLARFHELAAEVDRRRATPPAWIERLQLLNRLRRGGLTEIEMALRRPLSPDINRLAAPLFESARRAIHSPRLADLANNLQECDLQPAIRDIHHDHVLFNGDEVTALIDFGAMRVDTPLADVARLVGSLTKDDSEARRAALAAYAEIRPLTDDDRRLIELLDESGIVLGALNWLTWLYVERRDMGPTSPIAARLSVLFRRLASRRPGGLVDDA